MAATEAVPRPRVPALGADQRSSWVHGFGSGGKSGSWIHDRRRLVNVVEPETGPSEHLDEFGGERVVGPGVDPEGERPAAQPG